MIGCSKYQKYVYDRQNEDEESAPRKTELRVRRLQNLLGDVQGKKILDIGCSDGQILEPYIRIGDCYGVDISKSSLRKATSKGISTCLVDLEKGLPFKENSFDVVICSHVLEHLVDTDFVLSEINRVLKKDGHLLLSIPNINTLLSLAVQLFLDFPPQYSARYRSPHVRDFTVRTIKVALKLNGFYVERLTGTYIVPFRGKFSQRLAQMWPRWSDRVIIRAVKKKEPKPTQEKIVFDIRRLFRRKSRVIL